MGKESHSALLWVGAISLVVAWVLLARRVDATALFFLPHFMRSADDSKKHEPDLRPPGLVLRLFS